MPKRYIGESGLTQLINLIKGIFTDKQDKVTGTAGALAGFDKSGNLSEIVIGSPTKDTDLTNKKYVDDRITEINDTIGSIDALLDEINGEVV